MTEVGFIGLGTMGSAMALRLVRAGHGVSVWNRSSEAAGPVVAAGATLVDTPAHALSGGIAFSMLANDTAVREVFSEETMRSVPDAVHINMSTVSLAGARDLDALHARAGVHYAAAPVLGRPALAAEGQLNIVAAGSQIALDRAAEFFPVLGKKSWILGPNPTHANIVKIAVNYNLIHAIQAIAESVNLVELGGVHAETFVEIMTDAAFTGSAYTGYGGSIARRKYLPAAFRAELGMKDLELAQAAAEELNAALPTGAILSEIFAAAMADPELRRLDWAAVAEVTRRGDL